MFIGREMELGFLEDRYQSAGGQLVVIYGRRRVGKTELLRKFCEGKEHLFYSCTESLDAQQLTTFSERMLQKNIPAAKYISCFANWEQALGSVLELPGNGKKLLIIDEFPYMVKGNASIPSILQNLWDAQLKNANVMIVLCGSAMSFIEKEILAEKNPLYGRTTGILKVLPLDFYDSAKFLPSYSMADKIAAYAILGGIPHYLKQFDDGLSLEQNICKSILSRGSILYSEVEFLMRQELRETSTYNMIIEAIALGNTGLNDIYQKTQIDKTKLSAYLKNLRELGIIYREFSVESSVKEQANVQRGLYQLTDNYFRFWYAFVFPNLSELETGDALGIWRYVVQPKLDLFISRIFEDICRQYLRRQNRKNALPFHFTKIGRWWNKTDEIDILAMDNRKQKLLLGECKYKNTPMRKADLEHLQGKMKFAGTTEAYYYLFSKNGYSDDVLAAAQDEHVVAVEFERLLD
ncbi:ATP-binding protein [Phascolarctobacterium sp.]|uniref:ATP-binding protein n=1 Tax=Phascolarctobacterium sp. TaxID=2049039 RepID=UPI0038652360